MNFVKHLTVVSVFGLIASAVLPANAVTLAEYDFQGDVVTPSATVGNVTATNFVFNNSAGGGTTNFFNGPNGSGDDAFAADGWDVNGNDVNAAILSDPNQSDFFAFTITPDDGFFLDLDSLTFDLRASGTGPDNAVVRSNLDGFSTNLSNFDVSSTSFETDLTTTFDSSFDFLTSTTVFWVTGVGATASGGTLRIDNVVLDGTVAPVPFETEGTVGLVILGSYFWYRNRKKRNQA